MYCNKIAFIFVLSICVNIYNINCGCFCNSCKGNTTSGNGRGIKKIIIKVTADSINIDGKILNKLEKPNKPKTVVNSDCINFTNIYNIDGIDFNNNYETVIEGNDFKNKPYVIAIVEVKEDKGKLEHYIISFLNNKTDGLFYKCKMIKRILILESKNLTNMVGMFCGCSSLEELYFCNIDTSNVRIMFSMFSGCSSLKELNLNNFDTSNVTDMSKMFLGCSSLTKINISNFNTINVTDMSGMFYGCKSLTTINLNNMDTSNVKDMHYMFNECSSLEKLNLSNFNTKNVINMFKIFEGCSVLKKENIIVKDKKIIECLTDDNLSL